MIAEEAETPSQLSISTSLDMSTKMDIGASVYKLVTIFWRKYETMFQANEKKEYATYCPCGTNAL
jgi:hypothetical protein